MARPMLNSDSAAESLYFHIKYMGFSTIEFVKTGNFNIRGDNSEYSSMSKTVFSSAILICDSVIWFG